MHRINITKSRSTNMQRISIINSRSTDMPGTNINHSNSINSSGCSNSMRTISNMHRGSNNTMCRAQLEVPRLHLSVVASKFALTVAVNENHTCTEPVTHHSSK